MNDSILIPTSFSVMPRRIPRMDFEIGDELPTKRSIINFINNISKPTNLYPKVAVINLSLYPIN